MWKWRYVCNGDKWQQLSTHSLFYLTIFCAWSCAYSKNSECECYFTMTYDGRFHIILQGKKIMQMMMILWWWLSKLQINKSEKMFLRRCVAKSYNYCSYNMICTYLPNMITMLFYIHARLSLSIQKCFELQVRTRTLDSLFDMWSWPFVFFLLNLFCVC